MQLDLNNCCWDNSLPPLDGLFFFFFRLWLSSSLPTNYENDTWKARERYTQNINRLKKSMIHSSAVVEGDKPHWFWLDEFTLWSILSSNVRWSCREQCVKVQFSFLCKNSQVFRYNISKMSNFLISYETPYNPISTLILSAEKPTHTYIYIYNIYHLHCYKQI